jgi:hypothetical protein
MAAKHKNSKSRKRRQTTFYSADELANWREHWKDMPEFVLEDLMPYRSVTVHFECHEDMVEFFRDVMGYKKIPGTKWIWYPHQSRLIRQDKRYHDDESQVSDLHREQGAVGHEANGEASRRDGRAVPDRGRAAGVRPVRRRD